MLQMRRIFRNNQANLCHELLVCMTCSICGVFKKKLKPQSLYSQLMCTFEKQKKCIHVRHSPGIHVCCFTIFLHANNQQFIFESSWFTRFTQSLKFPWKVNLAVVTVVIYYKAVPSGWVSPVILYPKFLYKLSLRSWVVLYTSENRISS